MRIKALGKAENIEHMFFQQRGIKHHHKARPSMVSRIHGMMYGDRSKTFKNHDNYIP